ncbi:hypothetical protein TNCV_2112571 [Trichonephila clavipes]|nr:hypothetical protein TNCV_2112571 [Trichonephila clavipes]
MTIVLAWQLRYSFSDRKVHSNNLSLLVTLTTAIMMPSILRKSNQAVRHMMQPTSRHAQMTQLSKPLSSKERNFKHARHECGIVRSPIRRITG